MKHIDIHLIMVMTVLTFTYYKGYLRYLSRDYGTAAVWAICAGTSMMVLICRIRYLRFLHMRFKKIDKLNGKDFEDYLKAQFQHLGYRAESTGLSHDYGADLILKKHGKRIVVQAKRYDKHVGITAVQEVVGAIAYYEADLAMVVTNSGFTKSARTLARQNDVELWDRDEIRKRFAIPD